MKILHITAAADPDPDKQEPPGTRTAYVGENHADEPYLLVSSSNISAQVWVYEDSIAQWFTVGDAVLCKERCLNVLPRVPAGMKFFVQICKAPANAIGVVGGLMNGRRI
jgi:hypothetical protein